MSDIITRERIMARVLQAADDGVLSKRDYAYINRAIHDVADLESQLAEKDKELSDAQWQLAEERRSSMKKDKEIAIAVKQLREMGLVGIPDRLEQALKGGDE